MAKLLHRNEADKNKKGNTRTTKTEHYRHNAGTADVV